jgi:hypothetical protein
MLLIWSKVSSSGVCCPELGAFGDAEETMPHRRRVKKNSFGGHFDDLVKHFTEQPSKDQGTDKGAPRDDRSIHDRLFESAWRHGGAGRPER